MADSEAREEQPTDWGEFEHFADDNPDDMYINNATLMGNLIDKSESVKTAKPETVKTDKPETLKSDYLETVKTVETLGDNRKEGVSDEPVKIEKTTDMSVTDHRPGVRTLKNRFENIQGLPLDTKTASPFQLPGMQTKQVQQAEPFVYALAKDVPDSSEPEKKHCDKCLTLGSSCPSCALQCWEGVGTGYCIKHEQKQTTGDVTSPRGVEFNVELRRKLETRNVENEEMDNNLSLNKPTNVGVFPESMPVPTEDESLSQPEQSIEQTLYDSVCNTPTSSVSLNGFVVVDNSEDSGRSPSGNHGQSRASRSSRNLLKEGENYDWKRKEAKRKSRTLKRSPKSDKASFIHHAKFEDPKQGAIPEAERDDGLIDFMSPFGMMGDDSGSISDFTDSSFDSDTDKSENDVQFRESYSKKPLPPEPAKHKAHVVRDLRQLIYRGDIEDNEDKIELEKVCLRRKRDTPALPEAPTTLTQNQIKLRGVLQSLVDSEKNYITSLERLAEEYRDPIQQQFGIRKQEVVTTFNKVVEILQIHVMFQIELGEKLNKWGTDENIGNTFHLFSGNMALDIYSEYVNNYEAASEYIKDNSNTKQAFRDFLKERQMSSLDRLSLSGLMLKPIQRYPQFIMIIKDLLKYTPRDHHDRVPLQEALTGMENVAHQLNERKRQSEQYYHGNQIVSRLVSRVNPDKRAFLIRQDDVEQLGQDTTGQQNVKQRRLFLMNDKLISVHVTQKELNGGVEKFTYKWQQSLSELELTTSAITPNMQTTVHKDATTTILSPKIDHNSEDPYSLATDLTDMVHDINLLAQIQMLVSALRVTYPKLNEDLIHEMMTNLQKDIQGVDYQLQLLNSSSIILHDKVRKRKYVFSAASASIKQEWCIDFLLAKYALDVVNIPSWYKQEITGIHDKSQPALMMKHLSVDMQRTFTKIKCAVPVYFPLRNEGVVEHLWVCCSTEGLSQVSIVSLHTARPALVESFTAAHSEIVCAEMVEGFAIDTTAKTAFADDTVWMSTTESEILVFMLSERDTTQHRKPIHVFKQSSIILCMLYLDDRIFCGNRNGNVVVFNRSDTGEWMFSTILMLEKYPVKSIICVNDTIWVACGPAIHIIDPETNKILGTVDHQQPEEEHFNCLVKAGVGVWASFLRKSNISLYHVETKHHLQDFNTGNAVSDFISVHSGVKESNKNFEVTSLMASLGLLWVGTDIGVVLTYPLPRLRDGVPKINQRPSVSLHGHNHAVQFIIPVHYGPVSGTPIKRRPSEILKKSKVTQSVLQRLPKLNESVRPLSDESHKYLSLDAEAMVEDLDENLYEPIDTSRLTRDSVFYEDMRKPYEDVSDLCPGGGTIGCSGAVGGHGTDSGHVNNTDNAGVRARLPTPRQEKEELAGNTCADIKLRRGNDSGTRKADSPTLSELHTSGEHTYFVLEKEAGKQNTEGDVSPTESDYTDMTSSMRLKLKSNTLGCDVTRPKSSPILDSSGKNFQSELKNKLKNRKSVEDIADRDVNTEEVSRLYQTLMRPRTVNILHQDSLSSQHSFKFDDSRDVLYTRPNYKNPILPQKPNTGRKVLKIDSVKQKRKASGPSDNNSSNASAMANKHKVVSSFSTGGTVDTLRRQDSNTILVLTGGDGYKDWKKRQSLQSYRPEEPSLVYWLYKF